MKNTGKHAWFMKADVCPVSGLPVSCREVYVSDFPDADYFVEMAKLGERIFLVYAVGYDRLCEMVETFKCFDSYISNNFRPGFFYIQDYSGVTGVDAAARKMYIDYFLSLHEQGILLGMAFYNIPLILQISINIARRFKLRGKPVYFLNTYREAMAVAGRFLDEPRITDCSAGITVFKNSAFKSMRPSGFPLFRFPPFYTFVSTIHRLKCLISNIFIRRLIGNHFHFLLDYIASIDWHKPGSVPSDSRMHRDPFIRKVIDAISYLKSELDDVFEQRDRAESVLRESEKKYRLIVEHANAGICEYDYATNRLMSANDSFLRITGYSRQQALAMDPLDMFSESSRKLFMRRLSVLYSGQKISPDITYEIINPDSGIKYVLLNTHIEYKGKLPAHATVVITDVTEMKRVEEKLRNYQARLKELSIRLLMSEERQKKSLAAQLHEQVSQELFVALMDVNEFETSVADPVIAGALAQIKDRLSDIIVKTRNLTFDLSPPALYDLGLAAAVERLAETAATRHGIAIETRIYLKTDDVADDDVKVIIYRAIRELLHNCVKHAKARHVLIEAGMNGNLLEIMVEDDGVGFDSIYMDSWAGSSGDNPVNGGFGLFDIREKLSHLGGELVMGGATGKGSRILMKIPMPQEPAHEGRPC